jgi:hypothetical protein
MANNIQTAYDAAPATGYAGQLADAGPHFIVSGIPSADVVPGIVLLRSDTGLGVAPPTAAAASATAILATGGASTAGTQTLSGASLNGAVGVTEMVPPRNVTLVLSNHADWDATSATVTGLDADGEVQTEALAIPNGGNATVTGTKLFASIVSVAIPAQTGTGGTFRVGTGTLFGDMTRHVAGASLYDAAKEPGVAAAYGTVNVLRQGRVRMRSEGGNPGDPVWVRITTSGAQVAGAVRSTQDGVTCTRLRGAQFKSTTASGIAVVDFNLPR